LTHQPKAFVPAVPLAREGQQTLVRFLAGRAAGPDGQASWDGAFAAVAALKPRVEDKE